MKQDVEKYCLQCDRNAAKNPQTPVVSFSLIPHEMCAILEDEQTISTFAWMT